MYSLLYEDSVLTFDYSIPFFANVYLNVVMFLGHINHCLFFIWAICNLYLKWAGKMKCAIDDNGQQ